MGINTASPLSFQQPGLLHHSHSQRRASVMLQTMSHLSGCTVGISDKIDNDVPSGEIKHPQLPQHNNNRQHSFRHRLARIFSRRTTRNRTLAITYDGEKYVTPSRRYRAVALVLDLIHEITCKRCYLEYDAKTRQNSRGKLSPLI